MDWKKKLAKVQKLLSGVAPKAGTGSNYEK